MTDDDSIRSRTLAKHRELNEQLRDFLKGVLLFEKTSSSSTTTTAGIDSDGLSILSVKNDLLLQYLIHLIDIMRRRATPGQSLGSPSARSHILRLCEIRTYMEKIRPIEQKLQYQMDKLLKMDVEQQQQLHFRANIDNFVEEEPSAQEENDEQPKLYRPPKVVPMEFNEGKMDDGEKEHPSTLKRLEHLKRRAFHSDVLQDYKTKFSDAPEEIYDTERSRLLKNNREYKEKIAYEEDYLKRMPQTKKERLQLQRSMAPNGNEITDHMNDAHILYDDDDFGNGMMKKKKGKLSRKTKKHVEKKKKKSIKRLKSRN